MAGSIATLAILWVLIQSMGLFGQPDTIAAFTLPFQLETYFTTRKGNFKNGCWNLFNLTRLLIKQIYLLGPSIWEPGKEMIIKSGSFGTKRLPPLDDKKINSSVIFATNMLSRLRDSSGNSIPSVSLYKASTFVHVS